MMATDGTASRIDGKSRAGEDILPSPFRGRLGILTCQRVRHIHGAISLGQIRLVRALDRSKMLLQGFDQTLRQRHDTILLPFPVTHHDLVVRKIDILHTQPDAIHQPRARAV